MQHPTRHPAMDDLTMRETGDVVPDDQLVADAAVDVSAGRAPGEVATLDPRAGPSVEDELLSDAFDALPGPDEDDMSGPDEDDVESWVDESRVG